MCKLEVNKSHALLKIYMKLKMKFDLVCKLLQKQRAPNKSVENKA